MGRDLVFVEWVCDCLQVDRVLKSLVLDWKGKLEIPLDWKGKLEYRVLKSLVQDWKGKLESPQNGIYRIFV